VRLTNREVATLPDVKASLRQQEKLTVAAIVSAERGDIDLDRLKDLADALSDDWEIIVVAHSLKPELTRRLIAAIQEIPDATAHFLDSPSNDDIARLAALDMAIGDRVLLVDWLDLDVDVCRKMLETARQGTDVVLEAAPVEAKGNLLYRAARAAFMRMYNGISGLRIDPRRFANRLYSREAARYLLTRREAEMLLNTVYLADAFPGLVVRRDAPVNGAGTRPGSRAMKRAYRALNFARSVPLRFVIFICLLSAILNVAYMSYALLSKLMESNVEPGWSSLSLQISGIFLLLSIVLGIIAEHLIEVDRAVNRRPNYHVLREVRSPLSNARRIRNIVEMP
jgi:hypothetical protein